MTTNRGSNASLEQHTHVELSHLRRETRTALELALVAMAPPGLIERLAVCAGLLEAIAELPAASPPLNVHVPKLVVRSRASLHEWAEWQSAHGGPHD